MVKDLVRVLADKLLVRLKPDNPAPESSCDDLLKSVKRAAADEQDIGGVDLDKRLLGMFPPRVRRDI